MTQLQTLTHDILDDLSVLFPSAEIEKYVLESKLKSYPSTFVGFNFQLEHYFLPSIGGAVTEEEAAFKGIMELIERLVFATVTPLLFSHRGQDFTREDIARRYALPVHHLYNKTSNGWAVHFSAAQAIENATNELIERHVVLKAMAQGISPFHLEDTDYSAELSRKYQYDAKFYVWRGPDGKYVCVARGIFRGNGVSALYGFGLGETPDVAKTSSMRELVYKILAFFRSPLDGEKLGSKIFEILNYHRSTKDPAIEAFFANTPLEIPEVDAELKVSEDLYAFTLPVSAKFSSKKEVFIARVMNPFMQDLFFEPWREELLNPLAVRSGTERTVGKFHIVD